MVQITRHVTDKSSIDDLQTGVVLTQTEHVATEVELLLADVRHSLTDHLTDVFSHDCTLFGEVTDEETQPVDLGWGDVDVVGGLFHAEVLFLSDRRSSVLEILFDVLESDEGHYFGLH